MVSAGKAPETEENQAGLWKPPHLLSREGPSFGPSHQVLFSGRSPVEPSIPAKSRGSELAPLGPVPPADRICLTFTVVGGFFPHVF